MAKTNHETSVNLAICPNCNTGKNVEFILQNKFNLYFCKICRNGFICPLPIDISKYYPTTYLQFPGRLANIRRTLHYLLQLKRKKWISKYLTGGDILDVGAGEGVFGKVLGHKFKVTSIDVPFAQTNNKEVTKVDFLKWKTKQKFDGIVFLESLEHESNPQNYLTKASDLLKKGGYIFIECPRFDCIESKVFGIHWLHLDLPRHLSHLTKEGIVILAKRCNLTKVDQKGALLYEFSVLGFIVSSMNLFKIKPFSLQTKSFGGLPSLLFMLLSLPFAFLAEIILYLFDQSPIEFTILKKKH